VSERSRQLSQYLRKRQEQAKLTGGLTPGRRRVWSEQAAAEFKRQAEAAAARIRADRRWRRCTCERALPVPDGRCERCYGEFET